MSEFLKAVEEGNFQEVKRLIESGADVNERSLYKNKGKETALHVAVRSGSLEMVKYLVELGADINSKSTPSETLLIYNVDIRKELVLVCRNDEIINILKHELKKSIKHRKKIKTLKKLDEEKMIKVICLTMTCFQRSGCSDSQYFAKCVLSLLCQHIDT